jgi:hypothetical protein
MSMALLAMIGLFSYRADTLPVSPSAIFELLLVFSVALLASSVSRKFLLLSSLCLLYIVLSYLYAVVIRHANLFDFLQIYKLYLYLLYVPFLINKNVFTRQAIGWFVKFLLIVFFLKYFYAVFTGLDDRPIIFRENNYELMFLALLFYLNYLLTGKVSVVWVVVLLAIFVLSGSRSAMVVLGTVLAAMYYKDIKVKYVPFYLALALIMFYGMYIVFQSRLGESGVEGIDRLRFLTLFFSEVENWSVLDFLLGAERITPMTDYTCSALSYYSDLFSYANDGRCYSVILHSFVLRVVFDHGLMGLLFLLVFLYMALTYKGYSRVHAGVFLAVVFLNGFSVSSFNSVYYMLALTVFLLVDAKGVATCKKQTCMKF